jgi:hypothetical protein
MDAEGQVHDSTEKVSDVSNEKRKEKLFPFAKNEKRELRKY